MKGIIIACLVLVILIVIIVKFYHNKYKFVMIKLEEAKNSIELQLQKKCELFDKIRSIISKELKYNELFDYLDNSKDYTLIELNDLYAKAYNELFKLVDDNEELIKNNDFSDILDKINNNETDLTAAINFYNDSAVIYNELVSSFPSNIIAFFRRYKKLDFYGNKKRKIYDILNDE